MHNNEEDRGPDPDCGGSFAGVPSRKVPWRGDGKPERGTDREQHERKRGSRQGAGDDRAPGNGWSAIDQFRFFDGEFGAGDGWILNGHGRNPASWFIPANKLMPKLLLPCA